MRNERAWPQQCWKSCANGSNIVALRFGDHGTKEMLGVVGWKVWPVSNFAQQHATTSNNMQQGVQTDTTCNIQQCWELLANNVASVCAGLAVPSMKWIKFFLRLNTKAINNFNSSLSPFSAFGFLPEVNNEEFINLWKRLSSFLLFYFQVKNSMIWLLPPKNQIGRGFYFRWWRSKSENLSLNLCLSCKYWFSLVDLSFCPIKSKLPYYVFLFHFVLLSVKMLSVVLFISH